MATCRFQGCEQVDVSEVLPLGWTLVLFETRRLPQGPRLVDELAAGTAFGTASGIQIERHRTLLCPDHAMYVAQLCGVLPPAACAEPATRGYRARG